ncbi:hypothetical protein BD310DRAFT_935706 [Dichomitus squalens]|uniref:Uncharacterized protein n=1 Tax=Dichomitus squalens TaxID=114155 RepID=A0A4Q9PKF0_9APHY|nr:hypothetical protein BD310DRAFT_935706 [Dichomitus squalens]
MDRTSASAIMQRHRGIGLRASRHRNLTCASNALLMYGRPVYVPDKSSPHRGLHQALCQVRFTQVFSASFLLADRRASAWETSTQSSRLRAPPQANGLSSAGQALSRVRDLSGPTVRYRSFILREGAPAPYVARLERSAYRARMFQLRARQRCLTTCFVSGNATCERIGSRSKSGRRIRAEA